MRDSIFFDDQLLRQYLQRYCQELGRRADTAYTPPCTDYTVTVFLPNDSCHGSLSQKGV